MLFAWDPNVIRYFLDRGADFVTGYPFAFAFGEKIRTSLGPWKECKQKYPHLAAQLQEQADRALRHFCFEGDLKWVSLLLWAGANPRSKGPTLHDDNEGDESEHLTGLMAANGKFRNRDYLTGLDSRSKASTYDVSDRQSTFQVLLN